MNEQINANNPTPPLAGKKSGAWVLLIPAGLTLILCFWMDFSAALYPRPDSFWDGFRVMVTWFLDLIFSIFATIFFVLRAKAQGKDACLAGVGGFFLSLVVFIAFMFLALFLGDKIYNYKAANDAAYIRKNISQIVQAKSEKVSGLNPVEELEGSDFVVDIHYGSLLYIYKNDGLAQLSSLESNHLSAYCIIASPDKKALAFGETDSIKIVQKDNSNYWLVSAPYQYELYFEQKYFTPDGQYFIFRISNIDRRITSEEDLYGMLNLKNGQIAFQNENTFKVQTQKLWGVSDTIGALVELNNKTFDWDNNIKRYPKLESICLGGRFSLPDGKYLLTDICGTDNDKYKILLLDPATGQTKILKEDKYLQVTFQPILSVYPK